MCVCNCCECERRSKKGHGVNNSLQEKARCAHFLSIFYVYLNNGTEAVYKLYVYWNVSYKRVCVCVLLAHPQTTLHRRYNLTFYFLIQYNQFSLSLCCIVRTCVCVLDLCIASPYERNVYCSEFSFFAIFLLYCGLRYT